MFSLKCSLRALRHPQPYLCSVADKYFVVQDPYCYPGLDVLRNKAGITDPIALQQCEAHHTSARIEQFLPDYHDFSLAALQKIHFFLFQDLYDWAGQLRSVDISKGATRFANVMQIEREAKLLFSHLQAENLLLGLPLPQFVERIAHYYGELNVIHPFRDGNGRAQRLFFELLAINAGYTFHWNRISADDWLQANIAAYYCKPLPLQQLMYQALRAIAP